VQAFDVLGNPVRRRILELLAGGARTSGEIVEAIQREFDISQPGVSQHLRVLRDSKFASSRVDGQRRIYELAGPPLAEVDAWLDRLRGAWTQRLDALATEIARGKRERRLSHPTTDVKRRA
jgi:DNA-binding transcriptional ArsR family regulator